MTPTRSKNFYLYLFAALYFVQGVINAYQVNFFKPHMVSAGVDVDAIAVVASISLLPFMLKFLYGILSDRVNLLGYGHRWPYMVIGVLVCALSFGVLFFVNPATDFATLAVISVVAIFFMAMFDATADGYAIDVTDPADHDRVQSYMTGGRAAGLVILSVVFGFVAQRFGYQYIFLVIAACLLLPLFLLFRIREPAKRSSDEAFQWKAFGSLLKGNNVLFVILCIGAWLTFQGIDGLVTLYMSAGLGASEIALGNYGSIKGVGMIGGAVIAIWGVGKFGRKTIIALTIALVTVGGLLFSIMTQVSALILLGLFWGVVAGLHWTIYTAVAMSISDRRIAGSMFTLYTTMMTIGLAVGDGVATSLTDNVSFANVFQMLALGNLILIPFAWWVIGRLTTATHAPTIDPNSQKQI